MPSLLATPQNICILRLSAIGDTCHVVPVRRTLQQACPEGHFTWVIGAREARLLGACPGEAPNLPTGGTAMADHHAPIKPYAAKLARGSLRRSRGPRGPGSRHA